MAAIVCDLSSTVSGSDPLSTISGSGFLSTISSSSFLSGVVSDSTFIISGGGSLFPIAGSSLLFFIASGSLLSPIASDGPLIPIIYGSLLSFTTHSSPSYHTTGNASPSDGSLAFFLSDILACAPYSFLSPLVTPTTGSTMPITKKRSFDDTFIRQKALVLTQL